MYSGVPEEDRLALDALFAKALEAEGQDYRTARAGMCCNPKVLARYLLDRKEEAKTWQEHLFCEILLEYAANAGTTNPLLKPDLDPAWRRGWTKVHYCGDRIAKKGVTRPMFVAEALWKGNELNDAFGMKDMESPAFLVVALTQLHDYRVRALVEERLSSKEVRVRIVAADCLRDIGSPRSVAALLSTYKGLGVPNGRAEAALESCASVSSIPEIEAFMETTNSKNLKEILADIIEQIRADDAEERKARHPEGSSAHDRAASISGPE
jgi:hypothetical protein